MWTPICWLLALYVTIHGQKYAANEHDAHVAEYSPPPPKSASKSMNVQSRWRRRARRTEHTTTRFDVGQDFTPNRQVYITRPPLRDFFHTKRFEWFVKYHWITDAVVTVYVCLVLMVGVDLQLYFAIHAILLFIRCAYFCATIFPKASPRPRKESYAKQSATQIFMAYVTLQDRCLGHENDMSISGHAIVLALVPMHLWTILPLWMNVILVVVSAATNFLIVASRNHYTVDCLSGTVHAVFFYQLLAPTLSAIL